MKCRAAVSHGVGQDWVIDEFITNTCSLDDINVGYQAMRAGENIRGVIAHGS